jgi:ribosomal protein S18 acetylase RimI-like enzyme
MSRLKPHGQSSALSEIRLEPVHDADWIGSRLADWWGELGVVSRGRLWSGPELSGISAYQADALVGLATWHAESNAIELVTINSLRPHCGIGSLLMEAVVADAAREGAKRLWLVTTNDNLDALRFYQRRGWRLSAVYPGSVVESRKIKPSIPEIGAYGIPIRDEIELEYPL